MKSKNDPNPHLIERIARECDQLLAHLAHGADEPQLTMIKPASYPEDDDTKMFVAALRLKNDDVWYLFLRKLFSLKDERLLDSSRFDHFIGMSPSQGDYPSLMPICSD